MICSNEPVVAVNVLTPAPDALILPVIKRSPDIDIEPLSIVTSEPFDLIAPSIVSIRRSGLYLRNLFVNSGIHRPSSSSRATNVR